MGSIFNYLWISQKIHAMEQKKHPQKDFRKRSNQFFLIGLVFALSTTLVAFEWRTSEITVKPRLDQPIVDFPDDEPAVRIFIKKPAPKLVQPKIVVPPAVDPNPDPTPVSDPNPVPKVAPVVDTVSYVGFGEEPLVPEDAPPVTWAQHMPEFNGGPEAMYKYLAENLKYPKMAAKMNVEAKLYVQFIVNKDGSISDVEVLRSEGFGLDEEAARVVKQMPNWKPGIQGGKKVRVIYILPINFSLL